MSNVPPPYGFIVVDHIKYARDLNIYIARIIAESVLVFKQELEEEEDIGRQILVPDGLKNENEWYDILDKIYYGLLSDDDEDRFFEAMNLFAKYFKDMWI